MIRQSKSSIWSIADCISFITCDNNITDDQESLASESLSSPTPDSITLSSNNDDLYDNDSHSTASSDWNRVSIVDLNTTKSIPIPKRKNMKEMIQPYSSPTFTLQQDIKYNFNALFYPYNNLQSVLFSQIHPYIEKDYQKLDLYGDYDDDIEEEEKIKEQNMNWNDTKSVNRFRQLIENLLISGGTEGIKEDYIYLMFASPKPTQIIQQLRFGVFANICEIHIDRWGRRTYHFNTQFIPDKTQLLLYNHSYSDTTMFDRVDMIHLTEFLETKSYVVDNLNVIHK
eukprot:173113_1